MVWAAFGPFALEPSLAGGVDFSTEGEEKERSEGKGFHGNTRREQRPFV